VPHIDGGCVKLILIAESKFEEGEYKIISQPRKLAVDILLTVVWFV
jgi:hypothetical protein